MSGFLFHICFMLSVSVRVAALRRFLLQIDCGDLTGALLTDYKSARWRACGGDREMKSLEGKTPSFGHRCPVRPRALSPQGAATANEEGRCSMNT